MQPTVTQVDVFVSECSGGRGGCPLTAQLLALLGRRVVASETSCEHAGQPQSMRAVLDLFSAAADRYGLVLVTRHDLVWTAPITSWHSANFSRVSFLGGCERRCAGCERGCAHCPDPAAAGTRFGGELSRCVQDVLHVMPGRLFSAFDAAVGARGSRCFDGANKGSGHGCLPAIEARAGPTGLVLPLDQWRPFKDVREPSPLSHLLASVGARRGGGATHVNSIGNNLSNSLSGGTASDTPCFIPPSLRLGLPAAMARRLCRG